MIAGGQMDSTSGGIKQFRVWIIFNTLGESVKGFLLPKNRIKTHILYKGEQQLVLSPENVKEALLILFFMYSLLLLVLLFSLYMDTIWKNRCLNLHLQWMEWDCLPV